MIVWLTVRSFGNSVDSFSKWKQIRLIRQRPGDRRSEIIGTTRNVCQKCGGGESERGHRLIFLRTTTDKCYRQDIQWTTTGESLPSVKCRGAMNCRAD